MSRRHLDVALCSALIVAALLILTREGLAQGGVETRLGSMLMPRVVAGLVILFSLMIGLPSLRGLLENRPLLPAELVETSGLDGVFVYMALLAAYWWAMPLVGFLVATPVLIFAVAVLLGGRSWMALLAVALITPTAIHYGSRELIRVYLPEWSL
ncbi:tripartite tricarboxylate transporter TctB family protein [Limimaricola cinnabarinus]|uniref:tripartite tricarboxylate transporter TctB family protein n=1 Tax=Limimaricola cinnabarinus TaxID=1125964 RepID=UPI0024925155|nr:tripartite tricarboxylate transporter TctB family protein [Limimaricola cinnabarinus]